MPGAVGRGAHDLADRLLRSHARVHIGAGGGADHDNLRGLFKLAELIVDGVDGIEQIAGCA